MPFAYCETAKCVAGEVEGAEDAGGFRAGFHIGPALHNAEERLLAAADPLAVEFLVGAEAEFRPAVGAVESFGEAFWRAIGGRAIVEGHDDVGAEVVLDAHRFLRGEADHGAVDVAFKGDAVAVEVAQLGKGEDLEAAGVGQHGAVPAGEFLQAAELVDGLGAGSQEEVVGVAEDDLGAAGAGLVGGYAFDGAAGPDGHEGRGIERAVGGGDGAEAGAGGGVALVNGEGEWTGGGAGH